MHRWRLEEWFYCTEYTTSENKKARAPRSRKCERFNRPFGVINSVRAHDWQTRVLRKLTSVLVGHLKPILPPAPRPRPRLVFIFMFALGQPTAPSSRRQPRLPRGVTSWDSLPKPRLHAMNGETLFCTRYCRSWSLRPWGLIASGRATVRLHTRHRTLVALGTTL